jgi:3-isopropylmalate/(R)-2-methylmalate dehydratase small subunit
MEGPFVFRGRVWVFGDNVSTDLMAPWNSPASWEERRARILSQRPDFVAGVQPGDVIVAGRNWGCGSSRESAVKNVKRLGVAAVVAESVARIFFRNGIALGLPSLVCPGVSAAFADGDELELSLEDGVVKNLSSGAGLQGERYAPAMLEIVQKGGLVAQLVERLGGLAKEPHCLR